MPKIRYVGPIVGVDVVAAGLSGVEPGDEFDVSDDVAELLLTDPTSRIPVTILPSGQHALLGGDNTALPALDFIESPENIRPGDRVVSSGDGGVFPPGLLVGQLAQASDGRLRVRLAADYGRLEFLRVLRSYPAERLSDTGLLIPPPAAEFIGPPMPPIQLLNPDPALDDHSDQLAGQDGGQDAGAPND